MTEDAVISALSAATRIACRQMTPQHLDALHASVELASGLSVRPDWQPKAAAHAELFTVLGDVAGDGDLARLVSSAAGRLHGLVLELGPAADARQGDHLWALEHTIGQDLDVGHRSTAG